MRLPSSLLAGCVALGTISGVLTSAAHADYVIVAMVALWLGFVWLPLAAAAAAYFAHRLGAFVPAVSFASSAAVANYFSNLVLLGNELRPHSWAYGLATFLAALVFVVPFVALATRVRRLTRRCS